MADTTLTLGVNSSAVRSAASDLDRLSAAGRRSETATQSLGRQFGLLKGAFAGIAASVVAREVIRTADAYKSLGARLSLVTTNSRDFAAVQAALFTMAQDTRVGLEQTTDLYASLARSTESLGVSQSDLLGVTKTINQALVVSGTSATSAAAALVQLGQGFAAGALRGDELNSVMEQAPRLARAIADGMGVSVGKLRELGAAGKITGETVFKALQKSAGQIDAEFKRMPLTVDQASTQASNALMKLIGVMDDASGSSKGLAEAISGAAGFMSELAEEIDRAARGEQGVGFLAEAFLTISETVRVLGANVSFVFKGVGREIAAIAAQLAALGRGDLQGFRAISEAVKDDAERARRELDKFERQVLGRYRLTGERLNSQTDPRSLTFGQKPEAASGAGGGGGGKTSKRDPYGDAVKSLREQIALVGQLTELEEVNAKIALGNYGKLNATQAQRLRSLAQELDAQKGLEALRKAATSTGIEKIKRDLSGMTSAYSAAESVLEELRTQGEVADRDYYEAKREFIRLNADAEVRALQAENAALAQRKGAVEDRIADERQMAANTARIDQIRTEAAAKTVIASAQESAAIRKVGLSYAEAEAAAQSYLDTLRRGQRLQVEGIGAGTEERRRMAERQQIEERFEQQRQNLASQRRSGDITEDQYAQELDRIRRFQAEALASLDETYAGVKAKQANAVNGITEATRNYITAAQDIAGQTDAMFSNAFANMEDALVNFVKTGKLNFKSLVDSILSDIARLAVRQNIAAPLYGLLRGAFGAQSNAGLGFLGGINVGLPAYGLATGTNRVPYDNFPALLHKGEAVVPAKYNPAVGGTGRPVQVEVINNGQPARGQASVQETSTATLVRVVLDAVASDIGRGGRVAAAMKGRGVNLSGALPVRG